MRVAASAPSSRLGGQGCRFGKATVQAHWRARTLSSHSALLSQRPWGSVIVLLETGHQAAGGLLAEGLGLERVRVDVVADQDNLLSFGEVNLRPFHRAHAPPSRSTMAVAARPGVRPWSAYSQIRGRRRYCERLFQRYKGSLSH